MSSDNFGGSQRGFRFRNPYNRQQNNSEPKVPSQEITEITPPESAPRAKYLKRNTRTNSICVNLSTIEKNQWKREAKSRGLSLSAFVRNTMNQFINFDPEND